MAEPEFESTVIGPEDKFIILATDGLWDVISYEEAVNHASNLISKVRFVKGSPNHTRVEPYRHDYFQIVNTARYWFA